MKTWITSDHHFGQKHRLKGRGFESEKEHDNFLIEKWNEQVKPGDKVVYLGDFCREKPQRFFKKLNGKISVIPGNHDSWKKKNKKWRTKNGERVKLCKKEETVKINGKKIHLSHKPPTKKIMKKHDLCLHGHLHGKGKDKAKSKDIGIDTNGYRLYKLLSLTK